MTGLRIGSVCTGYGGLDMAVRQVLGGTVTWVADPDPGASAVLACHHPETPNLGDITATDFRQVEPVDVLTAGFPCQDISTAGRGAGITEGTRSGLWFTIADAIGVLRPSLVVLENVRAIVARRPGLDVVLADLARLRFDARWMCLRASDVGAPHQRERWFLAAWPADTQGPRQQGPRLPRWASGGGGAAAHTDGVGGQRDRASGQPAQRHVAGQGGAAAHPAGVDQREPADQALTLAGSRTARPEPGRRGVQPAAHTAGYPGRLGDRDGRAAADPQGDRRDQRGPEPAGNLRGPDAALSDHAHVDWGPYGPAVDRWEHATGRAAPAPTEPGRHGALRLSPVFVEWLMGLHAGWVTAVPGLTRNQQLRLLGNGVVPQQGAAALTALLSIDVEGSHAA